MNPHTNPPAQLTVPATGAQTQSVDKPYTADPTCSCPSQANTALTTDGFKDDGVTAATTEDEVEPVEGDQQPKQAVKERKVSESYHGDDVSQGAQSGPLSEAEERLRKEVGSQGDGEEVGEAKNTAEGDDKW